MSSTTCRSLLTAASRAWTGALASLLLGLLAVAPAAAADESYGYVRGLEGGDSVLYQANGGESGDRLELNTPILTNDRLFIGRGSRVDIGLADRNLLRLASGTDLSFDQLAASGDGAARSTQLRLDSGELQLVVVDDTLGDEYPRIDTPNATVYVQAPGTYSVVTEGSWSTVTVRQGSAEVVTRRDSSTVRANEQLRIDGDESPRLSLVSAGAPSPLERWGRSLDAEVATANYGHVDRSLRYAAAPLNRHGSWYNVGGRYGWRPQVAISWRPYTNGRWMYTPSGLTWVSYEPWGWATSHYGGWDYVPAYGWTWFPGTVYAPAWVYWHWSDNYVGWCPTAYYTRYYGHYGNRFRWGIHGWAGGNWNSYSNWTFCSNRDFGRRDIRDYCLPGSQAGRRFRIDAVPRGILTTDTRAITPNRWNKPFEIVSELDRRARESGPNKPLLPDVSDFVARRRDLPEQVMRTVVGKEPAVAGTAGPRGRGRGGDETQWVDVNDEVADRLSTNRLHPGHTNEKPVRLATPRGDGLEPDFSTDQGGGRTRADAPGKPVRVERRDDGDGRATPDAKPAAGEWRTIKPGVGTTAPRGRPAENDSSDWRTSKPADRPESSGREKPAARSGESSPPLMSTPSRPAPRSGDDAWRSQGGGREAKPAARRGDEPVSRKPAVSAPTPRPEPRASTGDDWRGRGKPEAVAAPRSTGKPSAVDASPRRSGNDAPAARRIERPADRPVARDDWRDRGNGNDDGVSKPERVRVPAARPATPAPDPAESPAVRRIMDRAGVGMGRGPSPTPRPTARPAEPRTYRAPERTAKPERPTPPPSTSSRERAAASPRAERGNDRGGDRGGDRGKDRSSKDREPPQ